MSSPSDAKSTDEDPKWRVQVQQSYRNTEVRQIAKVLASLEPGATEASKLRLAMQFEDSVFKSAISLSDYHKRLSKRLKKLQKNYKPSVDANAVVKEIEHGIQLLVSKYGDDICYILKHAAVAVREMRAIYGEEKAMQLQQHMDGVQLWAQDLGINRTRKPNLTMSLAHLEKLKASLEKRLESVRSHTVKLADPDAFLLETLQKIETDFKDKGHAVRIQADHFYRKYQQLQNMTNSTVEDPKEMLNSALERINKPIPNTTDKPSALAHLDKMRAASTVLLAYLCINDKYSIPRNTLTKAHHVAKAGIANVVSVMKDVRNTQVVSKLTLQDAWLKRMVLPESYTSNTQLQRSIIKTQVLLAAGRNMPSNLMTALTTIHNAQIVKTPGAGTHLVLQFGDAFCMIIYFAPLLVNLRAAANEASSYWTPLSYGLLEHCDNNLHGHAVTYETCGEIVQERFRDASGACTQRLRTIFANKQQSSQTSDVAEIELLESSALLEFVQLARDTYTAN